MIQVEYEDGGIDTFQTVEEAEEDILEKNAAGVAVYMVTDGKDDDNQYGCLWSVKLQKEF